MPNEKPTIWFDRPAGEMQRELIGDQAQIVASTEDNPLANIEQGDGAIVGATVSYDASVYELAPRLRVVVRAGIGYDNLDLAAATSFGIAACNTPDGPTVSTAEHAVALIFAITKGLRESAKRLERSEGNYWARHDHLELDGSTLGLIGLGRIGSSVGRIMRGVGMNVVAYDPYIDTDRAKEMDITLAATPVEVVSGAHVVSVHAPLSEATQHLVGEDLLGAMNDGVYLVNTSRGGLVDQDALLAAVKSGKVRGAALDVTDPEPLPADHPLLGHDNVLVTPHVASATGAGRRRIFSFAVEEAMAALNGKRPRNLLNQDVWPGRNA